MESRMTWIVRDTPGADNNFLGTFVSFLSTVAIERVSLVLYICSRLNNCFQHCFNRLTYLRCDDLPLVMNWVSSCIHASFFYSIMRSLSSSP